VTTIAGSAAGYVDAVGETAKFNSLGRICTDGRGLFVVSQLQQHNRLRLFRAAQVSLEKIPTSTLSSDLEALLDDEENTDLILMAEGKPIYALKGLLKKRSEYFKKMLESSMKEGKSNSIDVVGSYAAIRAVILYLHTDELQVDNEYAVEVLQKAEEWCLPRLKATCEALLMELLSPENAPLFLVEAEKHGALQLREQCMSYMTNHCAALKASDQLASLSKELLLEFIKKMPM
jgi:hypothetical protein